MSSLLLAFGFSWMVVGAVIGLFVGHQHERHVQQLDEIAVRGSLAEYHRAQDGYRRRVVLHAHSFLFPLVAIVVGLVMPQLAYPATGIVALGIALMVAAPVWTLGGLRSFVPLMALGDILLLGSIVATAIGLARGL